MERAPEWFRGLFLRSQLTFDVLNRRVGTMRIKTIRNQGGIVKPSTCPSGQKLPWYGYEGTRFLIHIWGPSFCGIAATAYDEETAEGFKAVLQNQNPDSTVFITPNDVES